MYSIENQEVPLLIKEAVMICNPKFGNILSFHKEHPYKKGHFSMPDSARAKLMETRFGKILIIEEDNVVSLIAFILAR